MPPPGAAPAPPPSGPASHACSRSLRPTPITCQIIEDQDPTDATNIMPQEDEVTQPGRAIANIITLLPPQHESPWTTSHGPPAPPHPPHRDCGQSGRTV